MAGELYYRIVLRTGGTVHYDLSSDIASMTIDEEAGKPDQLTIRMNDPYKLFSHALREGVEVEVELGWVDDHSLVFRGHIYRVDGDFSRDKVPGLKVTAYDASMKMGLRKHTRSHVGQLDAIIKTIVGTYAPYLYLNGDGIQLTPIPRFNGDGIRQQSETDLAFVRRLASDFACEFYASPELFDSSVHFVSHKTMLDRKPDVRVAHERCGVENRLLRFEPHVAADEVELPRRYEGVDLATGERISAAPVDSGGVDMGDKAFGENLAAYRKEQPSRAQSLETFISDVAAQGYGQKLRDELGGKQPVPLAGLSPAETPDARKDHQRRFSVHGMRASGAVAGEHRIHAQTMIDVLDVGGYSGSWYLAKVRHQVNEQGYETEFECQR